MQAFFLGFPWISLDFISVYFGRWRETDCRAVS
jgi:hypothetical protein